MLVYVQAIPVSIPASARKFTDLEKSEFKLSHSSKIALAVACGLGSSDITAAGFSPILRETVARGASKIHEMPLCDNPQNQSSFFPKAAFDLTVIGENPDWIFSGASLAGLIARRNHLEVKPYSEDKRIDLEESQAVILVPDSGLEGAPPIDIRRIDRSMEVEVNPEGLLGDYLFRKMEERKPELLSGSPEESAGVIARRLQRITRSGV